MRKILATVGLLCAVTTLAMPTGMANAAERSDAQPKASVSDAPQAAGGPVHCDIPAQGWADCSVVKILAEDSVDVKLLKSTWGSRIDCNLNALSDGRQLNRDTAYLHPGSQMSLWHNNTGGTTYAELRCASPNPLPRGADLDVIRW